MAKAVAKEKKSLRGRPRRKKHAVADKIKTVPKKPGVYVFSGSAEKVLYVGKAKNLRSRLSSYFQKGAKLEARKASMVEEIRDLKFIVTENELEALALEANLIKQYRPRYNVLLRDDKSYPYLRLTVNETWPRLDVVRKVKRDGAMYFGPYVPSASMREALAFIRKNFGVRPCKYRLDRPIRPCIQYQMGRCPAPCDGLISHEDYMREVEEAVNFLKGRRTELLDELGARMKRYSKEQRYEDAAVIRDRIAALKRAWESQRVIAPELGDIDVIGYYGEGRDAAFVVFFVRNGVMIGSKEFYERGTAIAESGDLMHSFVEMFYSKEIIPPERIILGTRPSDAGTLRAWLRQMRGTVVSIVVPRGKKERELVGMAGENARLHFEGKAATGGDAVMGQVRQRLSLQYAPRSIGAFDVSNIHGAEAVGAFVWWEDGEFQKDKYRHMKIRTVEAIDDYAMMRETIRRTLGSLKHWPDLVVVDGGRGHLSAGLEAISEFEHPPEVVSLAKKPDRVFTPYAEEPVGVEDRSEASALLRRIRDEVHRFAIGFHKKLRGRRMLESPLEGVPGIGKKRRLELLKRFGSVEEIRRATVDEIAEVPGINQKLAQTLKQALELKDEKV